MRLFLIPAGIILGLIFGATVVAAPVWVSRLTFARGLRSGMAAGGAFALAQGGWALIAGSILFAIGPAYWRVDPAFRAASVLLLGFLAFQVWRASAVERLDVEGAPDSVFRFTISRSFAMPLRLAAYMALIVSVNLPLRIHGLDNALPFALGIFLGHLLWLEFFALVAWTGRNVSDEIRLRSLNKLRFLSVAVLVGLALIAAGPFFFREYTSRF